MRDPSVETLDWIEQRAIDDTVYRKQVAYLFKHSPFYRDKLMSAGFSKPVDVGGLENITAIPFTTKDELRHSRTEDNAVGAHLAASAQDIRRIYSTSGTTGTPSYIPLTQQDISNWVTISSRSYAASGARTGDRIVSTYNAGPFVAGVALDAFAALGLCHIPVGTGNTERLMAAVQLLKANVLACTPSYALYLAEWAEARGIDIKGSAVERILVAGEPGGGRTRLTCPT